MNKMGILNDFQIINLCHRDHLKPMLSPFEPVQKQKGNLSYGLSYFGYDIRIGATARSYYKSTPNYLEAVDPTTFTTAQLASCSHIHEMVHGVVLRHGDFLLCQTYEKFTMPPDVVGLVRDKSTLARLGIAVQNTVLEPGWKGYLTIEISNHGPLDILLKQGMPIAQVQFFRGKKPSRVYSGKYQSQEGATLPLPTE